MNRSIVHHMIIKDWQLHRRLIVLSVGGGILALSLLQIKNQITGMLGIIWFFVALIVLGCMLPVSSVINERKKQTLPFMMSFPLSPVQYATAKLIATVGMYLASWITLVLVGLTLIISRADIPDGLIPMMLVLAGFTFVGFCVTASTALVSESEGWTIAGTIICNSTYGFAWYMVMRNPTIRADLGKPTPIWSSPVLNILAVECIAIAVILGI